jgi:hypothetical protein
VCPELKIESTWTVENLGARPSVDVDGQVERAARDTVFELIFALDVPTTIPRVGLTLEAVFIPLGKTSVHPFTGGTAAEAGRSEIRDNGIEIETELNVHLFGTEHTGGWVSSHVDIVDQFSPGKMPRAGSVSTHKLDFEWDYGLSRVQSVAGRPLAAERGSGSVPRLPGDRPAQGGRRHRRQTVSEQGEPVVIIVRHGRSPRPAGPVSMSLVPNLASHLHRGSSADRPCRRATCQRDNTDDSK